MRNSTCLAKNCPEIRDPAILALKLAASVAFMLACAGHAYAAPVVIDFESVPGGDLPSYTESGVTFDAIPASGTVTIDFSPGPNGTNGLVAEGADFLPIRADIAGGAVSVSVDIGDFDGDEDDLFLRVYNSSDVLLDSDSVTIPADFVGMMTLSTAAPGIAYAIFGGIGLNEASNVYSDNFTFEIPEPGTLVLLLLGATMLAIRAGARRKLVDSLRKRLNALGVVAAGTVALAAVFVLASSRGSCAAPVVIDFESFPPGPFASHTESDVTFSAVGGGGAITTVGTPNLTLGLLDSNGPRKELRADIGPHATFVSVDLGDFDADADLLFLEVFDAADTSLGFTSVLIDEDFTGMMTLSLAAADIAYAEFGAREPALNGSSVYADNFTFERVPEPGTFFLLLVGAAILAFGAGVARKPGLAFRRIDGLALCSMISSSNRSFGEQPEAASGRVFNSTICFRGRVIRILTVCLLGIGAVLILGAPARAQIEFVNFLPLEHTVGSGGLLTQGLMAEAFLTPDFDYIRTNLTGDAYFNPRNNLHENTGYSFISAYEITIGPVPVLLYDITLTADALLASSGVTGAPTVIVGPTTDLMVSASVADVDDLGTPITGTSLMRQIFGNGSHDIDEILLAPEVVLAAGETYRVSLDVSLDVDIQNLSEEDDPLITHQFGGLTDFAGYQIEISAVEVPEPGAWTILLVGAATIGVWRLRRRLR